MLGPTEFAGSDIETGLLAQGCRDRPPQLPGEFFITANIKQQSCPGARRRRRVGGDERAHQELNQQQVSEKTAGHDQPPISIADNAVAEGVRRQV